MWKNVVICGKICGLLGTSLGVLGSQFLHLQPLLAYQLHGHKQSTTILVRVMPTYAVHLARYCSTPCCFSCTGSCCYGSFCWFSHVPTRADNLNACTRNAERRPTGARTCASTPLGAQIMSSLTEWPEKKRRPNSRVEVRSGYVMLHHPLPLLLHCHPSGVRILLGVQLEGRVAAVVLGLGLLGLDRKGFRVSEGPGGPRTQCVETGLTRRGHWRRVRGDRHAEVLRGRELWFCASSACIMLFAPMGCFLFSRS